MSRHKDMKISKEFCCGKRQLCRDRKWKNNETSLDKVLAIKFSMLLHKFQLMTRPRKNICRDRRKFVVTQHSKLAMGDNKTLSRQRSFMSRKTQHEVEVNSVVTQTSIVVTEVEKNYKKVVATKQKTEGSNLYSDKRRLCCNRKWKRTEISQDNSN